jgi:hypothetical protein
MIKIFLSYLYKLFFCNNDNQIPLDEMRKCHYNKIEYELKCENNKISEDI